METKFGNIPQIQWDDYKISLAKAVFLPLPFYEDKYEKFSHFKSRVLDTAVNEINRVTLYHINYTYIKKGKLIDSIKFFINMSYH